MADVCVNQSFGDWLVSSRHDLQLILSFSWRCSGTAVRVPHVAAEGASENGAI